MILDDLTFADGTPQHLELSIYRTETWLKRVLNGIVAEALQWYNDGCAWTA